MGGEWEEGGRSKWGRRAIMLFFLKDNDFLGALWVGGPERGMCAFESCRMNNNQAERQRFSAGCIGHMKVTAP